MDFRLVLGWVKHVLLARLLPFWQRNLVMSWGRLSWRFQVYWRKACQPACLPASIWHFLLIFQQLSRPPSCAFLATRFYCLIRKVALWFLLHLVQGICRRLQDLCARMRCVVKTYKVLCTRFRAWKSLLRFIAAPLVAMSATQEGYRKDLGKWKRWGI